MNSFFFSLTDFSFIHQQPGGAQPINLLEQKNIVPPTPVEHAVPPLSSVSIVFTANMAFFF